MVSISTHGMYKSACCQPAQHTALQPLSLHNFFLQAEIYTEDPDTHSTVLEEMEDKSQTQTKTEKQVQTSQTNREAWTTGEGQLLWKYKR